MIKGFKNFILRGNIVEIAVGITVGLAFVAVVTSFIKNLVTPLLAIPGSTNFDALSFSISGSEFTYGTFLNDLISFLTIAAVIYFAVVIPMNKVMSRMKRDEAPTTKACPECLADIPLAATKCMYCTSSQLSVEQKTAPKPRTTA
jgi:large conductance mechanosensitive channel